MALPMSYGISIERGAVPKDFYSQTPKSISRLTDSNRFQPASNNNSSSKLNEFYTIELVSDIFQQQSVDLWHFLWLAWICLF